MNFTASQRPKTFSVNQVKQLHNLLLSTKQQILEADLANSPRLLIEADLVPPLERYTLKYIVTEQVEVGGPRIVNASFEKLQLSAAGEVLLEQSAATGTDDGTNAPAIDFSELLAAVESETAIIDSVVRLLELLNQMSEGNNTELWRQIEQQKIAIAYAVLANAYP